MYILVDEKKESEALGKYVVRTWERFSKSMRKIHAIKEPPQILGIPITKPPKQKNYFLHLFPVNPSFSLSAFLKLLSLVRIQETNKRTQSLENNAILDPVLGIIIISLAPLSFELQRNPYSRFK